MIYICDMENDSFLVGLNERQKEAVLHTEGRVRIIAGAGSGKTRVLAHRFAYLVNVIGVHPSNILCMTFTNKAAQEMKQRILKLIPRYNVTDFVCTIHGLCVKILRKEIYRIGYPKNFSIIDEEDEKSLAKQVISEMGLERTSVTVRQFLVGIRKYKAHTPYVSYIIVPGAEVLPEDIDEKVRFIQLQQKFFALDFDDLIYFTLYILLSFKDAMEYWTNQFNYMMVDEVQDCNVGDWDIINILESKYHNLFIVGDPDQAIYEWRGSMPSLFIGFKSDRDIILNQNYRSTSNILDVANSVICHNSERIEKELITQRESGPLTVYYHAKNDGDEAEWIAMQIKTIVSSGGDFGDISILYRASYLSRSLEQELLKNKIPYTIWGGIRFFERKEIKDILAYLRLIEHKDDISFQRIINTPSRKFGKVSLAKIKTIAEKEKCSLMEALTAHVEDKDFDKPQIRNFVTLIEKCDTLKQHLSISELTDYVLKQSGLQKQLRLDEDEERLENVEELINSIKYYEQINQEEEISLDTYLQEISLYTNADYKPDTSTVKLMTVHQSKGLEFPFVFVCGLTEGIFPSHRSIRERRKSGEEEERRLMYVAVTRTEKTLFLTEAEGFSYSTRSDKYPSRFLMEIKEDLLEVKGNLDKDFFKRTAEVVKDLNEELNIGAGKQSLFEVGKNVMHSIFGKGTVIDKNETAQTVLIKFSDKERWLMPNSLKLLTEEVDVDNKSSYEDIKEISMPDPAMAGDKSITQFVEEKKKNAIICMLKKYGFWKD